MVLFRRSCCSSCIGHFIKIMRTCADIFSNDGLDSDAIRSESESLYPGFQCERHLCSPYSPGLVEDDETVVFLLIDPLHFDEERQSVVPGAFQELTTRDLSVIRKKYASAHAANATREELIARGFKNHPEKPRLVDQVCVGSVEEIRAVREGGARLFGVFDTALSEKICHASIFASLSSVSDRKMRKIARQRLYEIMTKRRINFMDLVDELVAVE
ncbi:MAG: hypothetical protein JWM33_904 [Caulobacteraceae bacterium]|nr:hypothetical protein [Caulobacteraceae bacterium]